MKYIIYFSVMILSISCSQNDSPQKKENSNKMEEIISPDTTSFLLENGKYGKSWLDLIKDEENRKLVFQTRRNQNILAVTGYGNSEVVIDDAGEIVIDTIDLDQDMLVEYLFHTSIIGSTYGAGYSYVAYKNNEWDILRLPFDRNQIIYDTVRNEYLIVSYNPVDSIEYKFNKGFLIPSLLVD